MTLLSGSSWRAFLLTLLVAFGLGLSCDSLSTDPVLSRPRFTLGQRWFYTRTYVQTDSTGAELFSGRDSIEVTVGSVSDSVPGFSGLVRLDAQSLDTASILRGGGVESVWYTDSEDRLTEVAYRNPSSASGIVVLRTTGRLRTAPQWSMFDPLGLFVSAARSDSIQLRDDPRIVLLYPLVEGKTWNAFSSPFLQVRTITAIAPCPVGGSEIRSAVIDTRNQFFTSNDRWTDYVDQTGLLRRVIVLHMRIFDEQLNDLGESTYTDTYTLVGVTGG